LGVFNSEIAAQYDLLAPDIFATETVIGLWDGFMSAWYRSVFWMAQLASDGRIYVSSAWSTHHWHYIDYPNRTGEACGFVQHGIEFPVLMGCTILRTTKSRQASILCNFVKIFISPLPNTP
jgi:hypothetical protein